MIYVVSERTLARHIAVFPFPNGAGGHCAACHMGNTFGGRAMSLKSVLTGVVFIVQMLDLTTSGQTGIRGKRRSSAEPKSESALPIQPSDIADVHIPDHLRGFQNLEGVAVRGSTLFLERLDCASCHGLEPGDDFGAPNLAGVARRLTAKKIVTSILEPSRELVDGYRTITVIDAQGRTYSGNEVAGESDAQRLVLDVGDTTVAIARTDIDEILDDPSPMPENQADDLTPQEFSDLVAFLLSLR
jgi:putative heme-binding domain-containing protein